MNKDTGQPKRSTDVPPEMVEQPFEEIEGSAGRLDVTYHSRIMDFLAKSSLALADVTFWLYKLDGNTGNGMACIDKFTDCDPPDEHEVGLQYGSGRYMLMMTVPETDKRKKIVRSYKFKCHPSYDSRRNDSSGRIQLPPEYFMNNRKDNSLVEAFTMMQGMLTTLIPLFKPTETPDLQKIMSSNYSIVSEIMKKQALSSADMMIDYQRKLSSLKQIGSGDGNVRNDNGNDESDSGVLDVIAQIAPLLEQWLPKLLGGGKQSQVVGNLVRESAMFQEISKNRKLINGLIAHLDSTRGKEETDKVLKALQVKRMFVRTQQQHRKVVPNGSQKG